jgi:transposase InsO family protein
VAQIEPLYPKSIEDYIHWYNTEGLHSSLGYFSALEIEIKLRGIIKKQFNEIVTNLLGSSGTLYLKDLHLVIGLFLFFYRYL